MTDDELQNLYDMGQTYYICHKAWEYIERLEQQACNREDYIAVLKGELIRGERYGK